MNFVTKEPILKGWSSDKKYRVTDAAGAVYLLRISDASQYDTKKAEFAMMQKVAALGVSMCLPLDFGMCEDGVYSVQSFIDGADAEDVIMTYPKEDRYAYGLDAGRMLAKIHTIPAPAAQEDWEIRFNRKIDRKIRMYNDCPLQYENGAAFLDYLAQNRHLLKNRPQSFQHGDYHIGNMMLDRTEKLHIIDFNRWDFGDPWEEFNRIVWCAGVSPAFASGMVDGYFVGDVPLLFWQLLALYIASNTLSSLPWAIPFGDGEIETMRRQAAEVLLWYDDMKHPIPTWYERQDR